MSNRSRHWIAGAVALLLLGALAGCLVPGYYDEGGAYYDGDYEPAEDDAAWVPGYYVGPPRGDEHRRRDHPPDHPGDHPGRPPGDHPQPPSRGPTYRPAPTSRPVPTIPSRPAPAPPHGHPPH